MMNPQEIPIEELLHSPLNHSEKEPALIRTSPDTTLEIKRLGNKHTVTVRNLDEVYKEDFVAGPQTRLVWIPKLPDLPLILLPDATLSILPGQSERFQVRYPLRVVLSIFRSRQDNELFILPDFPLSRTWFGDPFNGEIAYSLPGPLQKGDGEVPFLSATTSFWIRNESKTTARFQRLCLRIPYLTLFRRDNHYMTNEVTFRIKDADQNSLVSYSSHSPEEDKGIKKVHNPRLQRSRSILKKSFTLLKSLSE